MICKICGKDQEFYKSIPGRCKECHKIRVHQRRINNLEESRFNESKNASIRTAIYRWKYPERAKAAGIVANSIRSGKIIKPEKCSKDGCEVKQIEAHHDDYSKPLEIRWLCKIHHIEADKERRIRENENVSSSELDRTGIEISGNS